MTRIIQVINSLSALITLTPATQTQIADAELQLRVRFSNEYKEYLASYGSIMADGIELSGIAKSEHRNVVSLTKKEWDLNPKIPHSMYVVENTCVDGIIIWQDASGSIYQSSPSTDPKQVAKSLADYLSSRAK